MIDLGTENTKIQNDEKLFGHTNPKGKHYFASLQDPEKQMKEQSKAQATSVSKCSIYIIKDA